MLRVHPFAAVRPAKGRESHVGCPPYDAVTEDEARALAAERSMSFIHVVRPEVNLPPAPGVPGSPASGTFPPVYDLARDVFAHLQAERVLVRDEAPRMYLYRLARKHQSQTGLVCTVDLAAERQGLIRRHEPTQPAKEEDRTALLRAVRAHTGPAFLAYRDRLEIADLMERGMNERPLYHFNARDGVTHTIWPVDRWQPLAEAFSTVNALYVADGHHRIASAQRYADELRREAHGAAIPECVERVLVALFPASQLTILPYHRVVRDLNGMTPTKFLERLDSIGRTRPTEIERPDRPGVFNIYVDGDWHRLELPPSSIDRGDPVHSLDATLLQERVLRPILGIDDPRTDPRIEFIGGVRNAAYVRELVEAGAYATGIMLPSATMDQLMAVADAGRTMPPKSTWFEPKMRSGLLVHALDAGVDEAR